jgi:hypothetical protein
MKKNNFIFLLLLISLVALLFTTCKKYPEDEFISLRTIRQRMEAEWQIKKIEINGSDVTYMYNDSLSQSIDSYRLWFDLNVQIQENNNTKTDYVYINKSSKSKNDGSDADVSVVSLGYEPKKNKKIWLTGGSNSHFLVKDSVESKFFIRFIGNWQRWDIRKLYTTEMIWSINNGSLSKKIVFKKTRKK